MKILKYILILFVIIIVGLIHPFKHELGLDNVSTNTLIMIGPIIITIIYTVFNILGYIQYREKMKNYFYLAISALYINNNTLYLHYYNKIHKWSSYRMKLDVFKLGVNKDFTKIKTYAK